MNTNSLSAETHYALIAEHFNELQGLEPVLVKAAARLLRLCAQSLGIAAPTADFEAESLDVCAVFGA